MKIYFVMAPAGGMVKDLGEENAGSGEAAHGRTAIPLAAPGAAALAALARAPSKEPAARHGSRSVTQPPQEIPMARITYAVTVTFQDERLVEDWLDWLTSGHIEEVLAGVASDA